MCCSKKKSIPPPGIVVLVQNPHPTGNSSFTSHLPLKILPFESLHPPEFPVTIHGVGMDIFLNHTIPSW